MGLKEILTKKSSNKERPADAGMTEGFREKCSYRPKDMPGLTPYIMSPDPEKLRDFLSNCFAFEAVGEPLKTHDQVAHLEMKNPDCRIMIGREGIWGARGLSPNSSGRGDQGISLYIYVPDVDRHYQGAKEGGAEIMNPPQETFWGDRMYTAKDIDGNTWVFATNVKDDDPDKVPQFH